MDKAILLASIQNTFWNKV